MVVPVERVSIQGKQKFVGNNLILNFENNNNVLVLTGNNCKVKLEENSGSVKVVGDHCELMVLKGHGNIKYIGNYGKIRLGSGMSSENVRYIGNEGNISSVATTTADSNSESSKTKEDLQSNSKKTCDKRPETKCAKKNINIKNCNMVRVTSPCVSEDFEVALPSICSDRCSSYKHLHRRK